MPSNEILPSLELFNRSNTKVYHKRSRLFKCKLKVFCLLQRPVSFYSKLYHYLMTGFIVFSCVVVNVFDYFFGNYSVMLMAVTDLLLACILTGELILHLWSCDCKIEFSGFKGRLVYLKRFGLLRLIDMMGIFTFVAFVCLQTFMGTVGTFLRLLHILQIFQIYRLIKPLLKLIISTVVVQFHQLMVAFIFTTIVLILMSFSLYLKEMRENFGVFDAFWLSFITLTTVGYGDESATTNWGKILTVFLAFSGIVLFQLPANIFGTGLAIKLKDEQIKLRLQHPAANLIQAFFRCYATDKESKQKSVWKLFRRSRHSLDRNNRQCIRFVLKFRYLRARHQFKTMTDSKRLEEDSELQLEMLRKVSLIETNLLDCKDRTHQLILNFEFVDNELQHIITDLQIISDSKSGVITDTKH